MPACFNGNQNFKISISIYEGEETSVDKRASVFRVKRRENCCRAIYVREPVLTIIAGVLEIAFRNQSSSGKVVRPRRTMEENRDKGGTTVRSRASTPARHPGGETFRNISRRCATRFFFPKSAVGMHARLPFRDALVFSPFYPLCATPSERTRTHTHTHTRVARARVHTLQATHTIHAHIHTRSLVL